MQRDAIIVGRHVIRASIEGCAFWLDQMEEPFDIWAITVVEILSVDEWQLGEQ